MTLEVRISLAASDLPGDPRTAALSVLQAPADTSARSNSAYVGGVNNMDWGMPGAIFLEDALPILNGYTSLQKQTVGEINSAFGTFTDNCPLNIGDSRGALILTRAGTTSAALEYIAISESTSLPVSKSFIGQAVFNPAYALPDTVSGTVVNGLPLAAMGTVRTSLVNSTLLPTFYLFQYTGGVLNPATLIPPPGGFPATSNRRLIAGLGNYLLLICDDAVYYSVPGYPLDMAGIGSGNFTPSNFGGLVIAAKEIANGVIIYTTLGAWAITQTFNGANPFKATQVTDLPGVYQVTGEPGGSKHFAVAPSGIYEVTLNQVTPTLTALHRHLVSESEASWDGTQLVFSEAPAVLQSIKLQLVGSRYLVLFRLANSGTGSRCVWVYDLVLNRMGRVKATGIFAAVCLTSFTYHPSTETSIYLIDTSAVYTRYTGDNVLAGNKSGLAIIGPIARGRNDRTNSCHEVLLSNVVQANQTAPVTVKLLGSPATVADVSRTEGFVGLGSGRYVGKITENYLYLVVEGPFELTNLIVKLTGNGL